MSYFFDKINKNSDNYKQGVVDARSELSAQIVDMQNQLQAANAKVLAAQDATPAKAPGNASRDAVLNDRKRIQRIMASSVAKYRFDAALKLVCETDMSMEQASSILSAMPENKPEKTGKSQFDIMMEKTTVDIGGGNGNDSGYGDAEAERQLAAAVIAANRAVHGNPKTSKD